MERVIGLTGKIGSGKGVISDYLRENYKASVYRFSKILEDLLTRLYISIERKNLQNLGISIRDSLGKNVLVNTLKKDIENDNNKIIVIDGIRYPNEVKMLRSFKNNLLLYVDAPDRIRYERCKKRGQRGESHITFKEFLRSESKETEKYIDKIKKQADFILDNSGPKERLIEQLEEILNSHKNT